MKKHSGIEKISGITLIEVLVVIVIVGVLVALLLPTLVDHRRNNNTSCLTQIEQINLGFLMFMSDHQDKYPMQIPVADGGTMEFIKSDHVFPHFQKLSEYQLRAELLHCPLDSNRVAAVSYEGLNDLAISYFLNADASTNAPSQTIVLGDRFLRANGQPIRHGLFVLTTNLD